MIWDVDSYIVLGDDSYRGFVPSGVDLIPEPWILEKLLVKRQKRIEYMRRRRHGTEG